MRVIVIDLSGNQINPSPASSSPGRSCRGVIGRPEKGVRCGRDFLPVSAAGSSSHPAGKELAMVPVRVNGAGCGGEPAGVGRKEQTMEEADARIHGFFRSERACFV